MLDTLRQSLEYLGGERDTPPAVLLPIPRWAARYGIWIIAILLIYAFCGQSSKFIYIDF